MKLTAYTYSNKGGKQNNEDYLEYKIEEAQGIFLLADGLGGHRNGEIASKTVVEALMSRMTEDVEIDSEYLRNSFLSVNELLLEKQKEADLGNMKTTAVLLHIHEDKAIWGHIGDSRLYYYSDNELQAITKDHSVSYKKYLSREISEAQINTDEDRTSLLGVLGNKDKCNPEIVPIPRTIKQGDAFLLCSDGFWEYIYREEILLDLLKSSTPQQWAELLLLRHIRRTKPDNDNFSVITVFVQ